MRPNLRITYRHIPASESLSAVIAEETDALSRHCGHPVDCHVTIEPQGSTTHVKRCRVHVDAAIPGRVLVANRQPSSHEGHDDPFLAVREAFRTLRHQVDRG